MPNSPYSTGNNGCDWKRKLLFQYRLHDTAPSQFFFSAIYKYRLKEDDWYDAHCKQILSDNADKLNAVVDYLLENESMTGEQFRSIMEGREASDASATALFDAHRE